MGGLKCPPTAPIPGGHLDPILHRWVDWNRYLTHMDNPEKYPILHRWVDWNHNSNSATSSRSHPILHRWVDWNADVLEQNHKDNNPILHRWVDWNSSAFIWRMKSIIPSYIDGWIEILANKTYKEKSKIPSYIDGWIEIDELSDRAKRKFNPILHRWVDWNFNFPGILPLIFHPILHRWVDWNQGKPPWAYLI